MAWDELLSLGVVVNNVTTRGCAHPSLWRFEWFPSNDSRSTIHDSFLPWLPPAYHVRTRRRSLNWNFARMRISRWMDAYTLYLPPSLSCQQSCKSQNSISYTYEKSLNHPLLPICGARENPTLTYLRQQYDGQDRQIAD